MTDIATNLSTIDGSLSDIKTAIVAKGVTPSGNITTFATAIGQISGGGGGSGKYQLLQRISDDSNNEIGTVSGFFTDANDVEYAVVCLDAQYRLASGAWMSQGNMLVTNLPSYVDSTAYSAKETSTFNTQKIVDYCSTNGYTSAACSHCRSKSFTINSTTYYGQLPNILELVDVFKYRPNINTMDTSASSYASLVIPNATTTWASTQGNKYAPWTINNQGALAHQVGQINGCFVIPVLELPNS